MSQRWFFILMAACVLAAPLAAGAASSQKQAPASKAAKKAVKPPAGGPKPTATAGHETMDAHRSPAPPSAAKSHSFDIPQAKSLAETPDVVLNSRVKASLVAGLPGHAEEITPQTTKGVVTLTGTVKTPQQRARAEQVARKVHGVRAVKNKLSVKGSG